MLWAAPRGRPESKHPSWPLLRTKAVRLRRARRPTRQGALPTPSTFPHEAPSAFAACRSPLPTAGAGTPRRSSIGLPLRATTMSSGREPGQARGAAGRDVDQLDTGGTAQRRHRLGRQRPWSGAHPDVGPPDAPLAHQRRDQTARVVVDRHGQPQPHAGKRSIDPDDMPVAGASAPPEFPGFRLASRLNHVIDHAQRAAGPRRKRLAQSQTHRRSTTGEPAAGLLIATRRLADLQRLCITQLRRMQVAPVDADHRQIAEGIRVRSPRSRTPARLETKPILSASTPAPRARS